MRQLEVCVDTLAAARIAEQCGADRLELCTDLSVGGLTPDPGLLEQVMTTLHLPVQVMIRPRSGGFIYTPDELQTMETAIRFIRKTWPGIRGFVTGALLPDNTLHREALRGLMDAAGPYPVTLHRVFDRTRDLKEALETSVELGIERILTSGGAPCVDQGIPMLKKLQAWAGNRIIILPGGGVRPDNGAAILQEAQVMELHLSGRRAIPLGPREDDWAYDVDPWILKAVRALLD